MLWPGWATGSANMKQNTYRIKYNQMYCVSVFFCYWVRACEGDARSKANVMWSHSTVCVSTCCLSALYVHTFHVDQRTRPQSHQVKAFCKNITVWYKGLGTLKHLELLKHRFSLVLAASLYFSTFFCLFDRFSSNRCLRAVGEFNASNNRKLTTLARRLSQSNL